MIGVASGEGRGTGVLVQPGDSVPGAPEYSVPGGFRGRVTHRNRANTEEETFDRRREVTGSRTRTSTATCSTCEEREEAIRDLTSAVHRLASEGDR